RTIPGVRARGIPTSGWRSPIRTHLPYSGREGTQPLSRNHINILTADALVILPGGPGTLSEIELAVRYATPAILFCHDNDVPPVGGTLPRAADLDDVEQFLRRTLAGRLA